MIFQKYRNYLTKISRSLNQLTYAALVYEKTKSKLRNSVTNWAWSGPLWYARVSMWCVTRCSPRLHVRGAACVSWSLRWEDILLILHHAPPIGLSCITITAAAYANLPSVYMHFNINRLHSAYRRDYFIPMVMNPR